MATASKNFFVLLERRSILSSPYCHVTRETNNYAKGGVTREPNTYASQSGI
jgi:hypothetical protein